MSAMQELTGQLIEKIRSRDNIAALEAVKTLRSFGRLAVLRGETLIRANLQGVNLAYIDLRETVLIWAGLQEAILTGSDLRGAVLFRANLQGADLTGSDLRQAYLMKANLQEACLDAARFDTNTILPDGSLWNPDVDLSCFIDPEHENFWRDNDPTSPAHQKVEGRTVVNLRNSRLIH